MLRNLVVRKNWCVFYKVNGAVAMSLKKTLQSKGTEFHDGKRTFSKSLCFYCRIIFAGYELVQSDIIEILEEYENFQKEESFS